MNVFVNLYEIQPSNEPVLSVEKIYPLLTSYGMQRSYNTVNISYSETSVERLYKIGNSEWKSYPDKPIRLEIGETIYAKGIDKYGQETRIIASYTASMPSDALPLAAYDGDANTYWQSASWGSSKIKVDASMRGKKISVHAYQPKISAIGNGTTTQILSTGGTVNTVVQLPANVEELIISTTNVIVKLYEIVPQP